MSREDNEHKPPFMIKLWLVPLLALLLLTIVSAISFLFSLTLLSIGDYFNALSFPNTYAAFTVAIYIIILFVVIESFIHPFMYAAIVALLKKRPTKFTALIVNVLGDTLVIYVVFHIFPHVSISGLAAAFSIALFVSMMGQMYLLFEYVIKTYIFRTKKK
ncbi:hypothetical protein [Paenibacillus taiwanensis]|uniref:hypothetical protein n=1 Tax=Paenibacillus taiwanensis TaxID=401638 RepID=UPI0012F7B470|nr:hypothetical protein [Paenibacillus taiwanensis]